MAQPNPSRPALYAQSSRDAELVDEVMRLRQRVQELESLRGEIGVLRESVADLRLEVQGLRSSAQGNRRDVEQSVLLLADTLQSRCSRLEQSVDAINSRIGRWLNVGPLRWLRALRRRTLRV